MKSSREIYVGGSRIVGNISPDSVYEGDIKFFDSASGMLVQEAQYRQGVLDGKRINYYPNGKIFSTLNYENGKNIGYNYYYDSIGKLASADYAYYDLKVGPTVKYFNGEPVTYNFYAFDNVLTYSLNYDLLKHAAVVDLEKSFFHLVKSDVVDFSEGNKGSIRVKYCLYLLNPPKYKFKYDLVTTDSAYKDVTVIDTLNTDLPFAFFKLSVPPKGSLEYAVRLNIYDSLNPNSSYMMFKGLK